MRVVRLVTDHMLSKLTVVREGVTSLLTLLTTFFRGGDFDG